VQAAKRPRAGGHIARLLAGLFVVAVASAGAEATALVMPPLATADIACELIGGRLQSVGIQRCRDAELEMAEGASTHGVPLLFRDYPATSRRTTPKRILLIGGIHGDELSSVSIVFQWMEHLAMSRFQPFHWRVFPCVNPDGLLIRPPTRVNANGVDLNRNFPTRDWKTDAMEYWQARTGRDARRYPGPQALSEPETRWLVREIQSFKPDVIVSVHAPFGVLDFDGPREPPERFGFLHLHQLGTYPGSLGNFAGVNIGVPVITLELPHAGIMPSAQQQQRIWADMLTWMEKNLQDEAPLYFRLEDHPWNGPR
jgi:hypothetical protein